MALSCADSDAAYFSHHPIRLQITHAHRCILDIKYHTSSQSRRRKRYGSCGALGIAWWATFVATGNRQRLCRGIAENTRQALTA
jgi:hypothetical protein